MFRLTLQTIRDRKARFLLTALAVVLGVAFMAGTLVLTDTINKAYDGIATTTFASTDAVVQSSRTVDAGNGQGTERGTVPASVDPSSGGPTGAPALAVPPSPLARVFGGSTGLMSGPRVGRSGAP